jgi:predicted AAA+ superfamily ATPase
MHPLTEREIAGRAGDDDFITKFCDRGLDAVPTSLPTLDIDSYLRLAIRGSFPELAFKERTTRQRAMWLDSYLDDLVTKDVASVGEARDPVRLRRYVRTLALNLAGEPTDASLFRDAGVNSRTASAYDAALTNLALLDSVPAWISNRLKRLTKGAKRYLVDTALAASAADVTEDEIIHDGDLRGRWFDAFAAMQLRAELAVRSPPRGLHHLRVEGGRHEVDLVIDLGRDRLFGVEIKAGAAPNRQDARHLIWLRDELGKNFAGGILLHSGRSVIELDSKIAAVPLSALWS